MPVTNFDSRKRGRSNRETEKEFIELLGFFFFFWRIVCPLTFIKFVPSLFGGFNGHTDLESGSK